MEKRRSLKFEGLCLALRILSEFVTARTILQKNKCRRWAELMELQSQDGTEQRE